jgi:hypothetical protein
MKICGTCNKIVTQNHTDFKCPSCGKAAIIRCNHCKESVRVYTCPECGFVGP